VGSERGESKENICRYGNVEMLTLTDRFRGRLDNGSSDIELSLGILRPPFRAFRLRQAY